MEKEPILTAFECEDSPGRYNVWRYDTPSTICVLFCVKANSHDEAIELAIKKINAP